MPPVVFQVTDQKTPQERKATLLADADIQAWIKDHRSPSTAKTQLEQLELFCRRTGLDQESLVGLATQKPNKGFRARVLNWVELERKAGRPDLYTKTIWYAVKSWLRYNEVGLEWSPALDPQPAATLEAERVPTAEELRRLLSVLSSRDRAAVLILASSGVRVGVLASRFEAGGITLDAFPDLVLGGKVPHFSKVPAMLHVPSKLSKSRKEYYTFITTEAAEALVAYLQERRSRGEKLTDASAVIGPEPKASHAHFRRDRKDTLFISGKSLGNVIRVGLRKVMPRGVRVRPHTLRSWTSTQLEMAERQGKITRSVREYFLGHNLKSVELRYNLGKALSQASLEELREVYARCEPFLSTIPLSVDTEREQRTLRLHLRIAGFAEAELEKLDLAAMTDEEIIRLAEARRSSRSGPAIRLGQRAVPVAEVAPMLEAGWEYVASLDTGRAILKAPALIIGDAIPSSR
jgi:integrase